MVMVFSGLMFLQNILFTTSETSLIISKKRGIYDLRLRILGNYVISEKSQKMMHI